MHFNAQFEERASGDSNIHDLLRKVATQKYNDNNANIPVLKENNGKIQMPTTDIIVWGGWPAYDINNMPQPKIVIAEEIRAAIM